MIDCLLTDLFTTKTLHNSTNEHHHYHHHDFSEGPKREERIENEDREVSSSSEYRREFEDARVAA
jgi:hypothetical protein